MRIAAILALMFALQLPGQPTESARIYVYAQRETEARSWLAVSCGGSDIAAIRRGTFFAVNVAPGRYLLSVQKGVPLAIEVKADEESFVRLDWHYQVGRPPIAALSKVPPAEALKQMTYLSYISAKRAYSPSVEKGDPRRASPLTLKTRTGK